MKNCPTCKRAVTKAGNKEYPFCCERCQLVDLGRWFGEQYRVPSERETKDDSPESPPEE
jgi:endogenous inhibitor of DNA gyrase (YacG/DUF329 family)